MSRARSSSRRVRSRSGPTACACLPRNARDRLQRVRHAARRRVRRTRRQRPPCDARSSSTTARRTTARLGVARLSLTRSTSASARSRPASSTCSSAATRRRPARPGPDRAALRRWRSSRRSTWSAARAFSAPSCATPRRSARALTPYCFCCCAARVSDPHLGLSPVPRHRAVRAATHRLSRGRGRPRRISTGPRMRMRCRCTRAAADPNGYYMIKVLLAMFVGLVRRRPVIDAGEAGEASMTGRRRTSPTNIASRTLIM